jgi:hypothetical protein
MAANPGKSSRKKRLLRGGPNYLIEVKGELVFVSGATGQVKTLTDEERDLVLPLLLRQRQKLGQKLAKLLEESGYDFSGEGTVELVVAPPEAGPRKLSTRKRSTRKRAAR